MNDRSPSNPSLQTIHAKMTKYNSVNNALNINQQSKYYYYYMQYYVYLYLKLEATGLDCMIKRMAI
jgi:hypothetical protein